jgi:hypothetical protein
MPQFGGKDSKRHFTVVIGGKEHGLYVSSTPSSAARKAVTKLCAANKSKKVEFYMREITQDSKKKTYGPYKGHIEKLKEPIELKGRVIRYKPVVKLSKKKGMQNGGFPVNFYSPKELLVGKIIGNHGYEAIIYAIKNRFGYDNTILSDEEKIVLGWDSEEKIFKKANSDLWLLIPNHHISYNLHNRNIEEEPTYKYCILRLQEKKFGSSQSFYIAFLVKMKKVRYTPTPLIRSQEGRNRFWKIKIEDEDLIFIEKGKGKEEFMQNLLHREMNKELIGLILTQVIRDDSNHMESIFKDLQNYFIKHVENVSQYLQ